MKPVTRYTIIRDISIICASILVAIFFARYNILDLVTRRLDIMTDFGSFIAGLFFTSVFTTAPATVVLGEIAKNNPLILTAFFGALGALLGDLFIFRFVRDNISRDFDFLFNKIRKEESWLSRHKKFFELHAFRYLMPFLGALIIASPLPDEIGLTILGLSKVKTSTVMALTFVLNFFGILFIGFVSRRFF